MSFLKNVSKHVVVAFFVFISIVFSSGLFLMGCSSQPEPQEPVVVIPSADGEEVTISASTTMEFQGAASATTEVDSQATGTPQLEEETKSTD